jgi:hypothetical protein
MGRVVMCVACWEFRCDEKIGVLWSPRWGSPEPGNLDSVVTSRSLFVVTVELVGVFNWNMCPACWIKHGQHGGGREYSWLESTGIERQ